MADLYKPEFSIHDPEAKWISGECLHEKKNTHTKILTQTKMCVAEYFESEVLILHRVAAFKSPFTEREGKVNSHCI